MKPLFIVTLAVAVLVAGGVMLAGGFDDATIGSNPPTALAQQSAGDPSSRSPASPSQAGTLGAVPSATLRTVTLKVGNLWCASCPVIVRRALEQVDGVSEAHVSYQSKTATVAFDPGKCDVAMLMAATAAIGYPTSVIR